MSLVSLDRANKRVLMFGGKGGVGKTTSSAAVALHCALSGRRTLIITNDFTPSLSDIFETPIGRQETAIPGVDNLWGLEIDPDEVMRLWKIKFGPQIYEAGSVLVDMSYDEMVDYVALAPGIQEEFMLDYILERVQKEQYDVIVWDTAPAGDTLRLLNLPQRFIEHLRVAPRVYMGLRDTFNLSKTPFTEIIESWKELSQVVMDFFTDPQQVEFVMVTIPEALGVYQSRRVIRSLEQHGLDVHYMIVNHVIQNPDCDFHRRRSAMQQPYIETLRREYGSRITLVELPLLPDEVKGIARLREVERLLFADVE